MILNSKKIIPAFLIFIVYLTINLLILKDYGLSWDYHYHHYAGLFHLGKPVLSINETSKIPFTSPDPRLTVEDPFGPFTQIIPTLFQILLSENLKILPFDIAYNLPMVFFGALGVLVLFLFMSEAFNLTTALASSLFLALNPTYFGYLHNNMKDIPNAFAYALSIWLFWRLTKYNNLSSLIYASLAFAFAFNVKINSIFIPVICGLYFLISVSRAALADARTALIKNRCVLSYFWLAPLLAFLVWFPFWADPVGKLLELPKFYSQNTYNMPVLYFGNIYRSGINIPGLYPYIYILITTPLPVLILALVGILGAISSISRAALANTVISTFARAALIKNNVFILFILWFIVPLFRYLNPKTGAIDGVRHFMEVLYPLSAFAGVGFWVLHKRLKQKLSILISFLIFTLLVFNLINFHPYQTSFFNSLAGGIKGANGKFDIDFWGTPQKEAIYWLNQKAPDSAFVHIVMGQTTSSTYLRPDLLDNVNKKSVEESDFVVLLNRQSFFGIYGVENLPDEKKSAGKIAFQRSINGIPLVWVFAK